MWGYASRCKFQSCLKEIHSYEAMHDLPVDVPASHPSLPEVFKDFILQLFGFGELQPDRPPFSAAFVAIRVVRAHDDIFDISCISP